MENLANLGDVFARSLIETGALKFGDFELKDGRKSPYFISLGEAVDSGRGLSVIGKIYAEFIYRLVGLKVDFVFGPAYKGIPLAAMVAYYYDSQLGKNLRWGYDRKEMKGHGEKTDSKIVGDLRDGDKVVIVDDVLTSSKTKIESSTKLKATGKGYHMLGVVVGVDREQMLPEGEKELEKNGLVVSAITEFSVMLEFLNKEGLVEPDHYGLCKHYQEMKEWN